MSMPMRPRISPRHHSRLPRTAVTAATALLALTPLASCAPSPVQASAPALPPVMQFGGNQWASGLEYARFIDALRGALAPRSNYQTSNGPRELRVTRSSKEREAETEGTPRPYSEADFVAVEARTMDGDARVTFLLRKDDAYVAGMYNNRTRRYVDFEKKDTNVKPWRRYPFPAQTDDWPHGVRYEALCPDINKGKLAVTADTMNKAVQDFAARGARASSESLCQSAVVLAEAARFKQVTDQVKTNWKGKNGVLSQKVRNYTLNWDKLSRYAFWQSRSDSPQGARDTNEPNRFNVGEPHQPQYVYRTGSHRPLVWDTLRLYTGNGRRYGTCGGVFNGRPGQPCRPTPKASG
ncbi:ribosome-inactivating family protein [Streptomyces sp. bgisy084]|uniref:ribosome-inactivating family protein n=1 Tax=Streptomyces sp. bgisy084 TaxID=3413777 RepID=UPI003D752A51